MKETINQEPIMYTGEELNVIKKEIEILKKEYLDLQYSKKNTHKSGTGEAFDNAETFNIERQLNILARELITKEDQVRRAQIVEPSQEVGIVELGKIFDVTLYEQDLIPETIKVMITNDQKYHTKGTVLAVTLQSPLGKAIYGKRTGETVAYKVQNTNFVAEIGEEILQNNQIL